MPDEHKARILVKILSIKVALLADGLVGLNIQGQRLQLNIFAKQVSEV